MSPVALVCTAILGLLVFGLGFATSGLRFRQRRLQGHSAEPGDLLHRFVRAHGNATEYAPFLAVLFVVTGSFKGMPWILWLIIFATLARVVHAIGLIAWPRMDRPNPFRFVGAVLTYVCGSCLCLVLLHAAWLSA